VDTYKYVIQAYAQKKACARCKESIIQDTLVVVMVMMMIIIEDP
jgi:hypothetical protein